MSNIISPLEIIHSAQSKGIKLFVDQGKLAVKKEKNVVLPSSLINLIKDHKSDLISFLETEIESSLGSNNLQIKRIKKSESYSVSDAQYRLWLVSQTEEGSIAYNISSVVNLDRTLDVTSFQEAVNAVIERHEILRTVFRIEETGEVRQYIKSSEEMGFSIDFKDCRGRDDANSYCQKYIETDKNKSFNLIDGPLFRASLLQLSNDRYIFYYNMHHIISDAWSKEVLSRDVMKYYEAYVTDSIPDISPLRIQYKDYAAWQLDELNSSSFQDHKNYWLSQFSTAPPVINLPTSKRRPKIKTYNGRELGIQLSSEITSKLRDFTLERGGTLSMGLLTVWKVLIYRYTGQTDITIGNPVAGRDHPDLEDQIGFYINVLPLRNKINPDHNFIQLFDQIKKNTLLAYKHQMYPFGKLLEDLSYIRDTSRSPLFDIDMDYHVTSKESLNPNSDEGVCDRGTSFAKFDIEFDPIESKDGVYIQIRFNTDVYDHGMIEKFILHYQSLLSCLLSDPIKSINDVHYLSKGETVQLLDDFNSVKIDIPTDKTMVDLFLDNVENHPNNLAVVFGETSLTYKELDEKSNRLAHYLISEKATNKGDFIGIHLDIGLDYMISLLGILKAGCAYVSIDTGYPSGRKRYLLDNSSIGVVITNTTYMFEIDFYEGELFAIDVELDSFQGDNFDINLSCPDDLAYVLYTSGSTGVPKGVMITHGNLLDYLSGLIASLGLDKGIYSYGLMSTPSADLGNTVLFGSLSTGGVLHLFSREMVMDVYSLISYFDTNPIDIIKMVPSHWYSLCSGDGIFLPDRSIIFGGEKLTNGVLDKIKESNSDVAVYNHYGPTETTVGKLIHKVDLDRDYTNIPIGKPFSNSGVYVLDSNMHLVPIGVVGELYIDGLGVSQGYLNNADLTTETFVSHPFNEGARMYKTGDLARWSEEGTIEFMGRADDQVKIRGHRVEVKEIESILNELDHISQSLVISQSDDSGSIRLIAYIVSDEAVLDIMGIDDALKGDLPDYMIPSVYEKLDAIPLTENGKVDYKALPKVTDGVVGPAREYVGPETDEEKALVAAWESVLKKERVSIKDNFYQLGGDSLKSIQMFVLLKKKGYDLPIVDIIENPILEDMAKTIKRISNQDNQFDILQSKTIEKSIEVSKNQKYFIKRPWAFILSNTISLSGFSESTFEKKILNLLGCYPSLCVEFEEHENDILQHRISSEKIKLAVKLIRDYDKNNLEKIEKKAKSFLEVSFDYFNSTPLIRFFLVIDPKDPHKVFLRFCIAHALVDIDTFAHISENLQHHFDNPKIPKNEYSNFDFALWQKNFLYSKQGREQRKWWLDYLEPLPLIDTKIQNKESVKYIIQHSLIIGEQFDAIKETIKEINIPVSVLFLAAQQYLLNEIGEESYLQKVAVNGGEQNYEEGSVTKVIGVTTNFLPLRIIPPANQTFKEYIYNIYEEYLKVRLYQNVPYETIKEDSLKATNTDIDKGIKGYFNFRLKETKILEQNLLNKEVSVSYKEQHWSNVYGIGLICDLYKNGIAIRLLCPEYIYEDIRYDVSLVSFVKKKLLDSMNLTSKT